MAELAQIRLSLNLQSSTVTPEDISAHLGVPFDKCHRIGDARARWPQNEASWQKNKKFWDTNWWILEERYDSTYASAFDDLPLALGRLIARVDHPAQTFADLASEGSAVLSVVIDSNGYPDMNLPAGLLTKIARLGVSIDFDLYCERVCERPHADSE